MRHRLGDGVYGEGVPSYSTVTNCIRGEKRLSEPIENPTCSLKTRKTTRLKSVTRTSTSWQDEATPMWWPEVRHESCFISRAPRRSTWFGCLRITRDLKFANPRSERLLIFVGRRGVGTIYILPEKVTITSTHYCKSVLVGVVYSIKEQRQKTETSQLILHHDNAPCHRIQLV